MEGGYFSEYDLNVNGFTGSLGVEDIVKQVKK